MNPQLDSSFASICVVTEAFANMTVDRETWNRQNATEPQTEPPAHAKPDSSEREPPKTLPRRRVWPD
jgi:hypothetical protein